MYTHIYTHVCVCEICLYVCVDKGCLNVFLYVMMCAYLMMYVCTYHRLVFYLDRYCYISLM